MFTLQIIINALKISNLTNNMNTEMESVFTKNFPGH